MWQIERIAEVLPDLHTMSHSKYNMWQWQDLRRQHHTFYWITPAVRWCLAVSGSRSCHQLVEVRRPAWHILPDQWLPPTPGCHMPTSQGATSPTSRQLRLACTRRRQMSRDAAAAHSASWHGGMRCSVSRSPCTVRSPSPAPAGVSAVSVLHAASTANQPPQDICNNRNKTQIQAIYMTTHRVLKLVDARSNSGHCQSLEQQNDGCRWLAKVRCFIDIPIDVLSATSVYVCSYHLYKALSGKLFNAHYGIALQLLLSTVYILIYN